ELIVKAIAERPIIACIVPCDGQELWRDVQFVKHIQHNIRKILSRMWSIDFCELEKLIALVKLGRDPMANDTHDRNLIFRRPNVKGQSQCPATPRKLLFHGSPT
ncbi:hypothetical protein AnigIFM49718_006227, partial [Aspergillus niger]